MPALLTSLRAKILAVVALLLVFLAATGLLAVRALDEVGERGATMYADRVVPLDDAGQMRALLGDIDSMIQRAITDTDAAARAGYAEQTEKDRAGMETLIAKYAATELVPAEATGLQRLRTSWAAYQESYERVVELALAGRTDAAIAAYYESADSLYGESDAALAELAKTNNAVAKQLSRDIHDATAASKRSTVALLLLALAVGTAVALFVVRRIVGGVSQVLHAADGIAAGDLDQDVDVRTRDEIGAMAAAFGRLLAYIREMAAHADRIATGDLTRDVRARSERDTLGVALRDMQADLAGLVGAVQRNAGTLAGSSEEMAATSEQAGRSVDEIAHAVADVAQGAERQVRSVEQAKDATEHVSAATRASAESARLTAEIARDARRVADEGSEAVAAATEAMRQVRASSGTVTDAMRQLSTKSEQIGGIVETITGIAGQTNLLALNAAIEAARAGEQGRGFAVVAEEVRQLAEESQAAAASIAALVGEIQAETSGAVVAVDESAARSETGAETVERARAAFDGIRGSVEEMSGRVDDIAAAVQEIAASAERVQRDMTEVAAVAEQSSASSQEVSASTEETSASAQEIAASAQQLSSTASELEGLVGRFRLTA